MGEGAAGNIAFVLTVMEICFFLFQISALLKIKVPFSLTTDTFIQLYVQLLVDPDNRRGGLWTEDVYSDLQNREGDNSQNEKRMKKNQLKDK